MAGNAVAGELRGADARVEGVEFAVATRADEAGLRALLRATPTRGGSVSLGFEREPDYFAGENAGGASDTTIVARREGRVVCMGRCSRRVVYVNGRRREAGYLGGLRLAPGTRGGLAVLRAGYAFFARLEAEQPAEFYYTSVASGNARARTVLESGRVGLPKYEALADLTTVAWPVRRGVGSGRNQARVEEPELIEFLDAQARRQALAMPWTEETWAVLNRHGLGAEDFCVVRREGRIVAAGGVWDQSAWRQTVVAGYAGAAGWLRPVINGFARVAGRPGLPAVGERLRQACVHPLAVAEDATEADVGVLLEKLERRAKAAGVEWLIASVATEDALRAVLARRSGAREYATRLYAVTLPGPGTAKVDLELNGQRVRPEAGLL
jgi:hypothetical protein